MISATLVAGTGLCSAATSSASPTADAYPEMDGFRSVANVETYKVVNGTGVWFTTPLGVNCAIEDDGSYGCSTELPGAPAGSNEVAWFVGDPFPRIYHTAAPRFARADAQMVVARATSISYRGSSCAVTLSNTVYCIHGDNPDSQIMVSTTGTLRGRDALPAG